MVSVLLNLRGRVDGDFVRLRIDRMDVIRRPNRRLNLHRIYVRLAMAADLRRTDPFSEDQEIATGAGENRP